jgi:hypothetical protein
MKKFTLLVSALLVPLLALSGCSSSEAIPTVGSSSPSSQSNDTGGNTSSNINGEGGISDSSESSNADGSVGSVGSEDGSTGATGQNSNPGGSILEISPGEVNPSMQIPMMASLFISSCNAALEVGALGVLERAEVVSLIVPKKLANKTAVGFHISETNGETISNNLNDFEVCLVSNIVNLIVNPDYADIIVNIGKFESDNMELRASGKGLSTLSDSLKDVEYVEVRVGFDPGSQLVNLVSSKTSAMSSYSEPYKVSYGESPGYQKALDTYNKLSK